MSKAVAVPFETTLLVRDHCLCLHLQRSARKIARRFDEALRPVGLTNGQFSLLMSLNRPESPAMGAVAALLAMDRTTLTAALKPLERRALVTVAPDPADRRNRRMSPHHRRGAPARTRGSDLGDHPCGDRSLARRPRSRPGRRLGCRSPAAQSAGAVLRAFQSASI
jgi:Transcriptional regulators